jgi:uncharacterized membrane protein YfcA
MAVQSSIEPVYYLLPLVGLIIGLFGSMLGGGGGFFFLPVLTLGFGVPAHVAVITSLVATLPICLVGSWGHYRKSNIDFRVARVFAFSGVAGAFAGAAVTRLVSSETLKAGFGLYSLLIGLNIAIGTWKSRKKGEGEQNPLIRSHSVTTRGSVYGIAAGIITGTFGTSGTAPVLAGLFSMHLPLKIVIGTSMLVVLVNSLFAVGAHLLIGQIDFTLVAFLTAGSAIGAFAGPILLSGAKTDHSENKVRYIYAVVMALLGIFMIIR